MQSLPKIGRYTFKIEQYQCNVRKMLRFSFLVNTMLSSADYHSTERGFGTDYLNTIGKTWVLSRLAVEMLRIPSRHEVIAVETWVEKVHPLFTNRNFKMSVDSTGEILGWGRSVWAMIDTTTRHPADLMEIKNGAIMDFVLPPGHPDYMDAPITKPVRIQMEDATLAREVDTYFSDVDFNGHINSMRYMDHILDTFPLDWHKKNNIKRLDIAYIAEGRPEVPIRIYKNAPSFNEADSSTDYGFKILQKLPENSEETEACRLRLRTIPLIP